MRDINTIVRLNNKLTVGTPVQVNDTYGTVLAKTGPTVRDPKGWVLVNFPGYPALPERNQWVPRGNVNTR